LEKTANSGVPKSLFVIILAVLAAMYYYAAFIDSPSPENTVEDFYNAYFNRDFDTAAEDLSVFWSVRFLPQYSSLAPSELIEKRDIIEEETGKVIAQIEENNKIPANLSIEILNAYTKKGENSALVVYNFRENGEAAGIEAAILIKEKGRLRIFNMAPISTEDLEKIQNYDITLLDESFKDLIES